MTETINENIVEFKKSYTFEGEEIKQIDLSPLENLTANDLIEADKIFGSSGQFAAVNELSLGYTLIVAAKAVKKPVEFFHTLSARDALKVKNKVMTFLNS